MISRHSEKKDLRIFQTRGIMQASICSGAKLVLYKETNYGTH